MVGFTEGAELGLGRPHVAVARGVSLGAGETSEWTPSALFLMGESAWHFRAP